MFKLKKIFILFSTLIIIFSFICLPVFADTGQTDSYHGNTVFISLPISRPNLTDNFAYIEVILQDQRTGQYSGGIYLISAHNKGGSSNDSPSIQTNVGSYSNNRQSLTFTPIANSSTYDYRIFYVNQTGTYWDLGKTNSTTSSITDTHLYNSIVSIRYYGFAVDDGSTIINPSTSLLFNLAYGTEYVHTALLQLILENMPGLDYIADAITDNADKNAAQIQQNSNQNAAEIQENADENTDKLLNGWENDTPVDSGGTGSLEQVESSLISGNQQGATNEISAANDSVLSSLSRLGNSFAATGVLFRRLSNHVPDTNLLIYFSLTIGVVPMIVGMGINGLRASDRRTVQSRREADFKRGYSAGYTKGKGG